MIRHRQATRTRTVDTDSEDVSARARLWLQSIREAVLLAVLVMYGFLFWAAVEVLIGG